ncbi:MAG TPA: hypothetical protein VM554_03105 [Acidisarcina sp.]|nr:hypothetical protein [Acidisarcina sp.]
MGDEKKALPLAGGAKEPIVYAKEPPWPALLGLLAVGGLSLSLPEELTVGPKWLLLVLIVALWVPSILAHRAKRFGVSHFLGYMLSGVITLAMVLSLASLVRALPAHKEAPTDLLLSAGALWITNILVFASWYWRLDAGGPHARSLREVHSDGAFLFPQMTQHTGRGAAAAMAWRPGFVDYLFLAFNTSTALSPADTGVLSRWAKGLMMVQSMISLATIALLAARAVNIL